MKHRKRVEWTKLDNASKIFPSLCNEKDTKVFRLACELTEEIDPVILQESLDITIKSFPLYQSILRRGVFWYYFEESDIKPVVTIEATPICAPLYYSDKKNLLFRVSYYKHRINLEIFHALSDGTGALWFLQTLVYHYLTNKYKEDFSEKKPDFNYIASISEKMDDSFGIHFGRKKKNRVRKKGKNIKAYSIRGIRNDEYRMKLIEGILPVQEVLRQAHEYNTTLTIYITSLFIYSIYKRMPFRNRRFPIILSVPINLRQYFESVSARNFFSTMNVGYLTSDDNVEFKDIVLRVTELFQKELTTAQLNDRLEQFMSLEKNFFTRLIPLPLKDYSLKFVNLLKDRGISAAISNLGMITMPEEFENYIQQFSFCTSARRPQICMCSYGDKLAISFTSPFIETDIQRIFFQFLSKKGSSVEITSNL